MNQQPPYPGSRQFPPNANAHGDQNGAFARPATANGPAVAVRQPEPLENNQNRAARYEDEKRRIIESCFSKRDTDGMQIESYITHVRVLEDASYPSSPPPPDSPETNKKNRVILVAVRRSGKVRVHKARENANTSFSIGKTWNLDELNAIVSYSGLVPATPQQHMEKQWAANTGFTVTLGKPYFWASPTSKEKDFFIASLIKIYRKYTGGALPELIGFAPQELELLTGAAASASQTPPTQKTYSPVVPFDRSATPQSTPTIPPLHANRPLSPPSAQPAPRPEGLRFRSQEQDRRLVTPEHGAVYAGGIRRPSQGDLRPPGRAEVEAPPQESPLVTPYGARVKRDDGRKPSLADSLRSAQSRPSISPKPSQSSLPPSETSLEPLPLRLNGYGAPKPAAAVLEPPPPPPGTASSQDASHGGGRTEPQQARRIVNLEPNGPPPPTAMSAPAPDVGTVPHKASLLSAEQKREEPAPGSQPNSNFVTPLETPRTSKEDERQKRDVDYFVPRKGAHGDVDGTELPKKPENEPGVVESAPSQTVADNIPPPPPPSEATSAQIEEDHRPGLGPMIKKKSGKDIRNQFRKAALAATAFQPRQGGAGARLKAMQDKQSNEPDGITSVVPAPLLRGISSDNARAATPELASPAVEKHHSVPSAPSADAEAAPRIQIERSATLDDIAKPASSPPSSAAALGTLSSSQPTLEARPSSPERGRSASPQRRRRQRLEAEAERCSEHLGIDPRLMDGLGADPNELLSESGWDGKPVRRRKFESFATDIRREAGRAQATGWLGHLEQQEAKAQELARAFDKSGAECEDLDALLTLYAHELDTLNDDIGYIELQGQGLQVQTANQKLLQSKHLALLKTLSISAADLKALRAAPMDNVDGMQAIEHSLLLLYQALLTIDPELRQNKLATSPVNARDQLAAHDFLHADKSGMRAVDEKTELYRHESMAFINRFNAQMKSLFQSADHRTSEENTGSLAGDSTMALNLQAYSSSRQDLWVYNAMMLFVREVNQYEWQTLISSYEITVKSIYQDQFRDYAMGLRKMAHRPAGEDQEVLFTHQEKEKTDDSLTSTAARKLTVRRGRTVKTSALRQSIGEKRDGKPEAWAVFETVLGQLSNAIAEEQNFIVRLFHLNSQANVDLADAITSPTPDRRQVPNLQEMQSYDPDRSMAKIVQNATEDVYAFWPMEMQALVEWVSDMDPLQGVGVLVALERCLTKYEETNQEFITRTVRGLHDRLAGLFHKFIEEQVRAIEETKVKVKKRRGLISFMRVFPEFSAVIEDMIPQEWAHHEVLEVRFIVNDAYTKILKAVWESLNFIAKDNPATANGGISNAPAGSDPEDKETLNFHILLIENMNYFVEEVKAHHNPVLEEWMERASRDQRLHLTQYTDSVIRRPLGKWLDFLESTEALMKSHVDAPASIANRPSHSRSSAKKVLTAYDAKEIRKGVETLRKRVEKHFTDADDPINIGSRALVSRVLEECAARYSHAHDRMRVIIDRVYDSSLEIDWRKEDIVAIFKR